MNLKKIREKHNLSQESLSKILSVSRSVYGMWETERDFIPLKRLNDFCKYFNVSFDYALGLTTTPNYPNPKYEIKKETIKIRLKNLRIKNNLTQEKLSQKINITRSLISKYENGTNLILTGFLIEYSKYFNISTDYILGIIDKEMSIKELTTV